MNKIITAGDTLSAGIKIALAVGAVVVVYRGYQFSQDLKKQAEKYGQQYDSAKNSAVEFATETVNPASNKNFIYQGTQKAGNAIGGFLFDVLN